MAVAELRLRSDGTRLNGKVETVRTTLEGQQMAVGDLTRAARPGLFVRKATGLVRDLGIFDMFVFSVNNQNIGLGVMYMLLFIPAFYFGADLIWSTILAGILCFFPVTAFALLNTIVPRSGGDYVWVSRVFGPWIGFATSWNIVVWMWFYIGAPMALVSQYGFASLLRYTGAVTNNLVLVRTGEWFYSTTGQIVLGTTLLAFFTAMFILGTKRYMRFQNVGFIIATLGALIVIGIFLVTSPADFQTAFDDYIVKLGGEPGAYERVLETARADPDFPLDVTDNRDWNSTFLSTVVGIYIMAFAFYSAYLGGEIKSARRTNLISMPLSVIYVTAFVAIMLAVIVPVVGKEFLAALSYFDPVNELPGTYEQIGSVLSMTEFPPHYNELASVLAPPVIGIFLSIAFLFWTYAWMPISMVASTRPIMAWSFDRVFPEKFSEVHPTYHTPVYAILLGAVIGWIALLLYSFGILGVLAQGTFSEFLVLAIVCLSAIVLPYRLKNLYDASPVAWYIAGIPVLSIIGVLGLITTIVMEYVLAVDPAVGLLSESIGGTERLIANLTVFASGFLLYPIIREIRKRQGIDVALAAKEIPPE